MGKSATALEAQVLQRPGCPVHIWLTGARDGPPLVLLHGAGVDHRMFEPQIAALANRHPLVLMDVRGHGQSRPLLRPFSIGDAVEDVLALIEYVGQKPAVLLGLSMGGNIAQEVVFRAPNRVAALIAADCACNTLPLPAYQRALLRIAPAALRLMPERLLWRSTLAVSRRPEVRHYLSDSALRIGKTEFIAVVTATLQVLHAEASYRTSCPLLILHGDQDNTGAIRQQAPIWATRDGAECAVIPFAGHLSNMDNPEAFNETVLGFLERVVPAR